MIEIGEVFFCESVLYYPDGSPREFINRLSSVDVQVYPYFFQCTVVVNLVHSEPLNNLLSIRIRKNDSYETIFESAPIPIHSNAPPRPNAEHGLISPLEADIPEPGDYIFEILLDRVVKYKEQISFT
jgi:hypothetical protein